MKIHQKLILKAEGVIAALPASDTQRSVFPANPFREIGDPGRKVPISSDRQSFLRRPGPVRSAILRSLVRGGPHRPPADAEPSGLRGRRSQTPRLFMAYFLRCYSSYLASRLIWLPSGIYRFRHFLYFVLLLYDREARPRMKSDSIFSPLRSKRSGF